MAKVWGNVRLQASTIMALRRLGKMLEDQGFGSDWAPGILSGIACSIDETVRQLIRRDEAHRIRARRQGARRKATTAARRAAAASDPACTG